MDLLRWILVTSQRHEEALQHWLVFWSEMPRSVAAAFTEEVNKLQGVIQTKSMKQLLTEMKDDQA